MPETQNQSLRRTSGAARRQSAAATPFVVGLGTMILAAHTSGISTIYPLLVEQFGASVVRGQWILTAYTFALTGCLLVSGGLADRFGLKRIYIAGMASFGISSGACALASGPPALVLLRGIEGCGAAMVSATSVALIGAHTPRRRLGSAVGWQTGITYAGLTLGPILAGYCLERLGWRVLFAVNLPIAAIAIVLAARLPAELRHTNPRARSGGSQKLPLPKLCALASVAAILFFTMAPGGSIRQASAAACAASGFAWFLGLEQGDSGPLVHLRALARTRIAGAVADESVFYLCLHAIGFLIPIYLTRARVLSATETGTLIALQNATRAIAAPLSGRLCDRIGERKLVLSGTTLLIASACALYLIRVDSTFAAVAAALVLLGAGAGLFAPANSKALLGEASPQEYGAATGMLATARNLGMATGVAMAALLYAQFGGTAEALTAWQTARTAFAVIAALAILYAALRLRTSPATAVASETELSGSRFDEGVQT